MRLPGLLAMMILFCGFGNAAAQCPPGFYPPAGGNVGACTRVPQYEQRVIIDPSLDRYGAIAFASNEGIFSMKNGYLSRADAEQAALKACRGPAADGIAGQNCEIGLWYRNLCGVVYAGTASLSASADYSEKRAKETGMRECLQRGSTRCEFVKIGCSLPVSR